jgi:2-hydroxy-6-oxonona-2,4-dienedioate hydrolase
LPDEPPPLDRWSEVDGTRWYWRSWDSAAPGASLVVLVHGFAVSSRYMVPLGDRLSSAVPVAAPDIPGHGYSADPDHVLDVAETAQALARWMDVCGFSSATWVGNSYGCQVIAALAVQCPALVERLVLISPTLDAEARSVPRQLGRLALDTLRERPLLVTTQALDYGRTGPWRSWQTARHMFADHIEDRLPLIDAPALVIRGGRDPLVPRRWAEYCANLLPNGRFVELPGVAHAACYSAAGSLGYLIKRFIRERHARVTKRA